MSAPRITPRPQRTIGVKYDPYRPKSLGVACHFYDDGTCALFVGNEPVRSIRHCVVPSDPRLPHEVLRDVVLSFAGCSSTFLLEKVFPGEFVWLFKAMGRLPR